jgi:hypothetical protein
VTKQLKVMPITLAEAIDWVSLNHSHLGPPVGGLLASSVHDEEGLRCVAILSRPVSRVLQAQGAVEITRVASDGKAPHAASKAIAAVTRAAIDLGWRRVVSSTLLGESGTSYRAAGWRPVALCRGHEWDSPGRERRAAEQPGDKIRWEFGPDALPYDPAVDALLRDSVGKVALPPRPSHMPLFDEGAA